MTKLKKIFLSLAVVSLAVAAICCTLAGTVWAESGSTPPMPDVGVSGSVSRADEGSPAVASVSLPVVFGDGMVLQRNKPINVFGYCNTEGATIKVNLGGDITTATVEDGRWLATLPAREVEYGTTLRVEELGAIGDSVLIYNDVNIGEVWVVSGQSNAQLQSGYLEDVEELAKLADKYSNIRLYKSAAAFSTAVNKYGNADWYEVDGATVRSTSLMSAVGYATVARLSAELGEDVPIGLVHVARGASKIKAWLDYESLLKLSPSEASKYMNYVNTGDALPTNAHTQLGCILYNYQIAPLEGYSVAGVIWYQGEGDAGGVGGTLGVEGSTYTEYFAELVSLYRRVFGNDGDLPFYVMQIAPYARSSDTAEELYEFKMEQYAMCQAIDRTYLVSLMNDGGTFCDGLFSQGYIHPPRKSTVGNRCAEMILANEYGIKAREVYTYPTPVSAVRVDGTVTVTFDSELELLYGTEVLGFELYNGSKWVTATGRIEGKQIILSADGVSKPTKLRYGCGEMQVELGDGTIISVPGIGVSVEEGKITLTVHGKAYVITDPKDYIRSMDCGNITNASGVPLVVFSMNIVQE